MYNLYDCTPSFADRVTLRQCDDALTSPLAEALQLLQQTQIKPLKNQPPLQQQNSMTV